MKLDIIEKVEGEPTPWVSPIVTLPKKDGKEIRLCVDMREANQAVKRERHTMPTIEELILDMNGAKSFSVSSTYVVVITSSSYIRSLVTSQRLAHTKEYTVTSD